MPTSPGLPALHFALSENGQLRDEIRLEDERNGIGRRPHNAIVLNDLTVSGEHAVVHLGGDGCVIRDLNSRNGTLVNGRPISECVLDVDDVVDIGIYRLRLTMAAGEPAVEKPLPVVTPAPAAVLEYLDGVHRGVVQRLDRKITRISGSDAQVVAIARRKTGFVLTPIEGMTPARLNAATVGPGASALHDGDLIDLGETRIRFRLNSLAD